MKKSLPIGYDNFKEIRQKNLYYVDKTNIISEMLANNSKVVLFSRPRRFGKSLLLSMINEFFDIEAKKSNKHLFDGLDISKSKYFSMQGTRAVINLDFKGLKQDNYNDMYEAYKELIRAMFADKMYLIKILSDSELEMFNKFLYKTANVIEYQKAIKLLSEYLCRYYNCRVVILIDEYDVPIQQGYLKNFYDSIITFIREVFSNTLKGNDNLELAIMSGVLRVSKESLFSDLNNILVYGITDCKYNEYFGFTESETKELLEYYDLKVTNEVKNMYNGYNLNGISIYNPWSIINYASNKKLIPYWVNTSGNELIKNTIRNSADNIKVVIERLLQNEEILFRYDEKVTFLDLDKNNNLNIILNFLFASGYLTLAKDSDVYSNNSYVKVPNREVQSLFYDILESYLLDNNVDVELLMSFQQAIITNNKELIENIINKNLASLSFYDEQENFYHGFVLGLFTTFYKDKYIIKSNREAGSGRFDILLETADRKVGVIIEFKVCKNANIEKTANSAIKQMNEKEYYKELELDKVETIYKYAIVFKGKKCIVR